MAKLHAQAYAYDGPGFYFDSAEEYEKKFKAAEKRGFEEFEIQFIDGETPEIDLFDAMKVHQGSVEEYFERLEELEDLSDQEVAAIFWLCDRGFEFDDALDKYKDVSVFPGKPLDYVYELIDDTGTSGLDKYFDFEAFGRDIRSDEEYRIQEDIEQAEEDEDEDEVERLQEHLSEVESQSDYDLGAEHIDSVYGDKLPEELVARYFDYKALLRDMEANSELEEYEYDDNTYTITNPLEF